MKRHLLRCTAGRAVLFAIVCSALAPAIGRAKDEPAAAQKISWEKAGMDSAIEGRIDKAVKRGALHANTGGRKKARAERIRRATAVSS